MPGQSSRGSENEQAAHPAVQDLIKGNGPASQGYYSVLGLAFNCTAQDIQKKYKRLALQCHPDKAGDKQDAHERFQAITTAYHVLSDAMATKAYWDMFRLRCYMYQVPHERPQPLMPFYLMVVRKRNDRGMMQHRMITLNLSEGSMQNWKKDKPHRVIPLSAIRSVLATGDCTFTISFKNGHREYKLATDRQAQAAAYISILQAIVDGAKEAPNDDSTFPPRCERKGYVEKRGKTGDWARRWLMLGTTHLLIFRNQSCGELVNAVPLSSDGSCSTELVDKDGSWCISAPGRRWVFRNSKAIIAKDWVAAVAKMLAVNERAASGWLMGAMSEVLKASLMYSMRDVDALLASVSNGKETPLLVDTPLEQARDDDDRSGDDDDDEEESDRPDMPLPGRKQSQADEEESDGAAARKQSQPGGIRRPSLSLSSLRRSSTASQSRSSVNGGEASAAAKRGVFSKIFTKGTREAAVSMDVGGGGSKEDRDRSITVAADTDEMQQLAQQRDGARVAEHLANRMVRDHV